MIDQKTLAYINLYGVLGTLENLCEIAPEASSLLTNKKPIAIGFDVKGGPKATIRVNNHRLLGIKKACENPRAIMEFSGIRLARDLFDGKVNAIACVGSGDIVMKGMISMLDNLNRILDRVALYLA